MKSLTHQQVKDNKGFEHRDLKMTPPILNKHFLRIIVNINSAQLMQCGFIQVDMINVSMHRHCTRQVQSLPIATTFICSNT